MCIYIYMEYPTSIRYQMGYMWIINHVLLQVGPAHPSMAQELIPNQAAHLSIHNLREQSRKGPPKNPGQGLAVATWILDDLFKSLHPCVLFSWGFWIWLSVLPYYICTTSWIFINVITKIRSLVFSSSYLYCRSLVSLYYTSRETSSPFDWFK